LGKEQKKVDWAELIVPAFGVAYVIYTLSDQIAKNFPSSTVLYGVVVGTPVVICAVIIAFRFFTSTNKPTKGEKKKAAAFPQGYEILADGLSVLVDLNSRCWLYFKCCDVSFPFPPVPEP